MFFKFLFPKKKSPKKIKLKLDEIESWIFDKNEDFFKSLEDGIEKRYANLEKSVQNLKEAFQHFNETEVSDDIFERFKKIIKTNKTIIEKNMKIFLDSFTIPQKKDYNTAYNFSRHISMKIQEFGRTTSRSFLIFMEFMGDEIKDFKKSISELEENIFDLNKFLKENKKKVKEIDEIISMSNEVQSMMKDVAEYNKEITTLRDDLKFKEITKKKIVDKLKSLEEGPEVSQLNSIKEKINDLKSKKADIESKIIMETSRFEKAFKKISYSENINKIEKYIKSPVDTLSDPKEMTNFKKYLNSMKNKIVGNKYTLSEKVKKGTLKEIERIESGILDNIFEEYKKISSEILQMSEEIKNSSILDEIEMNKNEIQKLDQDISALNDRTNELGKKIKEYEKKTDSFKKTLLLKIKELTGNDVVFD